MRTEVENPSSIEGTDGGMRHEQRFMRATRESSAEERSPNESHTSHDHSNDYADSASPEPSAQSFDNADEDAERSFNTASLVDYFNSSIKEIEASHSKRAKFPAPRTPSAIAHHPAQSAWPPSGRSRNERLSDENTQARDAFGSATGASYSKVLKRLELAESFPNVPDASLPSARLEDVKPAKAARGPQVRLPIPAGETSLAMGKAAPYWRSTHDAFLGYTDHAIPALKPREFAHIAMNSFTTAEQSYTQMFIWCLSRRMNGLGDAGASQVRLKQTLLTLRGKISRGSLNLFGRQTTKAAYLLKPTQPNPVNERRAQGYEVLARIQAQLESSRRDSFQLLDEAEKWVVSPAVPTTTTTTTTTTAATESATALLGESQLQAAHDAIRASMRQLAVQSLEVERVAEGARELISELQNHFIEARCDALDAILRNDRP